MRPVSLSSLSLNTWQPRRLKNYPHFDKFLSARDAIALATNPTAVAQHPFFPFISFDTEWNRFGTAVGRSERKKTRKIQYSARGDSYIYEYYRHLISEKYEAALSEQGLSAVPIAYRKIRNAGGSGCSNIDFAKEAFEQIQKCGNGYVLALDISKFFDSISHNLLKTIWKDLFSFRYLPSDHFAVFKNITMHSSVEIRDLIKSLGISLSDTRKALKKYLKYEVSHGQICSIDDFRNKICKRNSDGLSIVTDNKTGKGIPQGSPISDVLANLYMLRFDANINNFCSQRGIYYRRYSDDILFVIPKNFGEPSHLYKLVDRELQISAGGLMISSKKTRMHEFKIDDSSVSITALDKTSGPIEYLGFQFDGKNARIRTSTLSNLSRRIKRTSRYYASFMVRKYRGKNLDELLSKIEYSNFLERFFRMKDFETIVSNKSTNFFSYTRLSVRKMGSLGSRIMKQVLRLQKVARLALKRSLEEALARLTTSAAPLLATPVPGT